MERMVVLEDYSASELRKKEDAAEIHRRLDKMEEKLDDLQRKSYAASHGHPVWVFIPVAAIIMWGLVRIFG
ncbi:hypothetical protein LRR81_03370 [Metabacillus sp. GX 13764]|uniref:hypothetical protein n=1 Tax=Metabacillus kandeliae TaxID=2900151 RepID=UPI001E4119FD|nr:hypothetical protein [Metabacillus kandeliae]MCD7033257.1 hypothetical protein [Metabacillus kandeliae]